MRVLKALNFASDKHRGQVRKVSGLPYITHPIAVSLLLQEHKASKHMDELMTACILHDTLEDTDTTMEELVTAFSPLVATLVYELSSDANAIKQYGKNEYLKSKLKGVSNYTLVIKLADRLANIMDSPKPAYVVDTEELLTFLEENRRITNSQAKLIVAIREEIQKYSS